MSLPKLNVIQHAPSGNTSDLASALSILFEHSPILSVKLEPELSHKLKALPPLSSYGQLIDIALENIEAWDAELQSNFISGHPRIGESKNLSKLSATEQGAQGVNPTPSDVLARLSHLNACYEHKYPGLRYITFVNGRSRADIAKEMEDKLQLEHSLSPDQPAVDTLIPVNMNSETWSFELKRAIMDIGRIAKSRLRALGVE